MLTPTSLVLVCLLPTPRDLEIARLLGWYRIPFKSAPKVVAVDYLAFYLAWQFWRIRARRSSTWRRSRGTNSPPASNCCATNPTIPRANEEYYKIQIGALEKLAQPVKAEKWRRITFLYTTGEYLLKAKTINDLVVHSDERQLLWRSLRERAVNGQAYQTELPAFDVDPQVLIDLLGIKEIKSDYDSHDL